MKDKQYQIIEAEIKWCEEHKDAMPKEYSRGFIAGLKQAVYLLNASQKKKSVARYMVCKKHNEQDCELCSVLEL